MSSPYSASYDELNDRIKALAPAIEDIYGKTLQSFNSSIGMNYQSFCDIKQRSFVTPDEFKNAYFAGWHERVLFLIERSQALEAYADLNENNEYRVFDLFCSNPDVNRYVHMFLERSFYKYYQEYSRKKPPLEDVLWIGTNERILGIGVTPRFVDGRWENDKSEVRKAAFDYWTIGHILHTGFLAAHENQRILFDSPSAYVDFMVDFVRRYSRSPLETRLARQYADYVCRHPSPFKIPMLIPQFRYGGLEIRHQYRLDFLVINPWTLKKYGFELSPYATHGGFDAYERDHRKRLDFLNRHDIVCNALTDSHFEDPERMFAETRAYLEPERDFSDILAFSGERLRQLHLDRTKSVREGM